MNLSTLGIWADWESINFGSALLISLIAIVVVFFVLVLLILSSSLVNGVAAKLAGLTSINAREENKILDEDEDAAIAVLTATIDFHKETGKDANVVSVTRIED